MILANLILGEDTICKILNKGSWGFFSVAVNLAHHLFMDIATINPFLRHRLVSLRCKIFFSNKLLLSYKNSDHTLLQHLFNQQLSCDVASIFIHSPPPLQVYNIPPFIHFHQHNQLTITLDDTKKSENIEHLKNTSLKGDNSKYTK